ncbi:MAG: hypothetical protein AB1489_08065 [Acidobacteriota bacterium]
MKKALLLVFSLALLTVIALSLTAIIPVTQAGASATKSQEDVQANNNFSIATLASGPGFSINLTGSTVQQGTTTRIPIALVGQFRVNADGTTTGSRTLVTPAGPVPGGDFSCQTTEFNAATGVGKFACLVKDATTPPNGRVDTFQFVINSGGREMQLVLIGGVPGAVVSGVAKAQPF